MKLTLILVVVLMATAGLFIRLAPVPVAKWHVDPTLAPDPAPGGWRTTVQLDGAPAEVLARVSEIALNTPRTTLLAGSADEGRISFVTRSRLWGFPDITTISASADGSGTQLTLLARLRFGYGDMGVNRNRVEDWIVRMDAPVPKA